VPTLEPGGDPDLWRPVPVVVDNHAAEDERAPAELVDERLQSLGDRLLARAREEHPEWEWEPPS
jgi:hypothetical protein